MPLLFFPFLSSLKSAFHSRSEYRQLHSKLKKLFALNSSPFHHTPFCTIFCHLYRSQREGKKIHFVLFLIPSWQVMCWCASSGWGATCLPVALNVTGTKAMFRVGLSWSKCVALLASHHSAGKLIFFLTAWDLQWTLAGKCFRKEKWIFSLFLTPRARLHYSSSGHDSFVCQFAVLPVVCLVTFDVRAHFSFAFSCAVSSLDHRGKLHLCESRLHLLWLRWRHRADF